MSIKKTVSIRLAVLLRLGRRLMATIRNPPCKPPNTINILNQLNDPITKPLLNDNTE